MRRGLTMGHRKPSDTNEITISELKRKVDAIESRVARLDLVKIPIEVLPDGIEPYHANESDAGYDLFATETIFLPPGKSFIMPVGIKVAIPAGYEIQIRPRSGISSKVSLRIANSPGTIDSGYRDEVGVILHNDFGPATTHLTRENIGPVDINGEPYVFPEDMTDDVRNLPRDTIVIQRGDRIAQMVIAKVVRANFVKVDDVKEIAGDRNGGFGSTGITEIASPSSVTQSKSHGPLSVLMGFIAQ